MTWRNIPIACLVLLLTVPLSSAWPAQTAAPMYALTITPANPTTKDILVLKLVGTWPNNCPSNKLKLTLEGNDINIDMLLPGAEDGSTPACKAIKTDWQATAAIGPLAAGTYRIYARGVSYTQTGGYAKLAEVQVQLASTAPADPNTGSGQKPEGPALDPKNPEPPSTTTGQKPGEVAAPDGMKKLALGVSVILMDDSLAKECGLQPGQCGIVIAGEGLGHTGMLLVSWDFYEQGLQEACQDGEGMPLAYPQTSARWIDTRTVRLAMRVDMCGTLGNGQGECILFRADDGQTYNFVGGNALSEQIGATGQFHVGDHVRVRGLLQVAGLRTDLASLCPGQQGDIHCPILTLWEPPESKVGSPCTSDKLTVDLGHNQVRLWRDPKCPGGKHNLSGVTTVGIVFGRRALLSVKVTPDPGVGGTWKAQLSVEEVNANQWTNVKVSVNVDRIDVSSLPAGKDVVLAKVIFESIPQ
jgi:hypothetical protein